MKATIFDLNGVFITSPKLSDRFRDTFNVSLEDFLPALNEVMAHIRMPGARDVYSYWEPYLRAWNVDLSRGEFFQFLFREEREIPGMVELAREMKD